jgi:3',5'-nucleoside bisphosphate phosphatase
LKLRADLHIHTVLSPCAGQEMSPTKIVKMAQERGLDIIGITDHNSTLQCATVRKVASDFGIFVLMGCEVTTKEEVHCLSFFETEETLKEFQHFIDKNQKKINNDPKQYGFQAIVDVNDNIINQINYYLGIALDVDLNQLEEEVHKLGGIFIPAHVDRGRYSLMSQLGYVPDDIKADALEIFNRTSLTRFLKENSYLTHFNFIRSSDSHYLDSIGIYATSFIIEEPSFKEIRMALRNRNGRMLLIE